MVIDIMINQQIMFKSLLEIAIIFDSSANINFIMEKMTLFNSLEDRIIIMDRLIIMVNMILADYMVRVINLDREFYFNIYINVKN